MWIPRPSRHPAQKPRLHGIQLQEAKQWHEAQLSRKHCQCWLILTLAFFCGVIWQKINSRENTTPRSMKSLNIYCRYIAHRFNSFSLLRGYGTSFEATESGRYGEAVHEFGMDGTPNFALDLDFWEANEKAGASCHVKGSKIQENPPVFCQLFSMCPLKRRSESRGLCI